MITFLIKSTACLIVLYGFYHIFLRHQKILLFNRFYLIFSLVFSMIIPRIVIPIKSNLPLNITIDRFSLTTGQFIQGETISENSSSLFTYQNILFGLYILITAILLIRFALNIFKLIRKIIKSQRVVTSKTTLVLVEEKAYLYSFCKYIFVNRSDFENGKIQKELLLHEEAHCLQYHSIDIIIIELINIFLWFNPAIWLFRKSILLNHEYYADNQVLTNSDSIDYHQLLVSLVIQNNTNYLVSNFKYSQIKNRLIMMTKCSPSKYAILRKIAGISLFLYLGITFTFSQETIINSNISNYANEWWYPILQKHKVDITQFNFMSTFNTGSSDSIRSIAFEIGNRDSLNKSIITLKDPIFILRESDDAYNLITAKFASHDLEKSQIKWENGKIEAFSNKNEDSKPIKGFTFVELYIDTKTNKAIIKNISGQIII